MKKTLFTTMIAATGLLTSCGGGGGSNENGTGDAVLLPANCSACELTCSPGDREEGGRELVLEITCTESSPGSGSGALSAEANFYAGESHLGTFSMSGTWATASVNTSIFTITNISAEGDGGRLTGGNMQFEITNTTENNGIISTRSGQFLGGEIYFTNAGKTYPFPMRGEKATIKYTPRS